MTSDWLFSRKTTKRPHSSLSPSDLFRHHWCLFAWLTTQKSQNPFFLYFMSFCVSSAFNYGMFRTVCSSDWKQWSHDPLQTYTQSLLIKTVGREGWPKKSLKRRVSHFQLTAPLPCHNAFPTCCTQDLCASLLNKDYSPKATEAKPGWRGVTECTLWPLKSELAWLCGS